MWPYACFPARSSPSTRGFACTAPPDPHLVALVKYLARGAAERDYAERRRPRPSADPVHCPRGEWFSAGQCFNGIAVTMAEKQDAATIDKLKTEVDSKKRAELAREVSKIHMEEVGHIPLHYQVIPWAMRSNVSVVHRADNRLLAKWVTIK